MAFFKKRKNKKPTLVHSIEFNAAGVKDTNEDGTNRQDVIQLIVDDIKSTVSEDKLFKGISENRLMKSASSMRVYEVEDIPIDIQFEERDVKRHSEIFIHSKHGVVGKMPQKLVKDFLEHVDTCTERETTATILGGVTKRVQPDSIYGEPHLHTEMQGYKIHVIINFFE